MPRDDCDVCEGEGWVLVYVGTGGPSPSDPYYPDEQFDYVPCPECRPDEYGEAG